MTSRTPRVNVLVLAMVMVACGADPAPDSPDAGTPEGQGSMATGELVVNEVFPRGAGPDWIELLNRRDRAVDLCDYFVTDALDRLDHYLPLAGIAPPDPCPPQTLAPGAYLVIYADEDTAAGPAHAPFKLGVADEAHVVTRDGIPVDSFVYLLPADAADQSLARAPDGAGLFYLADPTPGAANGGVAP